MDHVRQVCAFAKFIPGFKALHHDDQVCLLKSCVFEVLLVRLSGLFENQVSVIKDRARIHGESDNVFNIRYLFMSLYYGTGRTITKEV